MAGVDPKGARAATAGMWSTIAEAVRGGWGPTIRLLIVLTALGAVLAGLVTIAGDSQFASFLLRAFLAATA